MQTFIIQHAEHGEAICNEGQFSEFEKLGWKKKEDPTTQKKPRKTKDSESDTHNAD